MKKTIQLILSIIIILSITIFYKKFFSKEELETNIQDDIITQSENNTIKNSVQEPNNHIFFCLHCHKPKQSWNGHFES